MVLRVYKGTLDGTINYSDYDVSGKISNESFKNNNEPDYQIETLQYMTNDVFSKVKLHTKEMYL